MLSEKGRLYALMLRLQTDRGQEAEGDVAECTDEGADQQELPRSQHLDIPASKVFFV